MFVVSFYNCFVTKTVIILSKVVFSKSGSKTTPNREVNYCQIRKLKVRSKEYLMQKSGQ